MNCPVCDRSLAPTLSICPSCGAMMRDTVREELQTKITPGIALRPAVKTEPVRDRRPFSPPPAMAAPAPVRRTATAGLVVSKTSPTLVGFQSKSASLPEWRLQMQNAVQQRRSTQSAAIDSAGDTAAHFPVNGGAALKAEVVHLSESQPAISDPRVANAMRRIEESRKTFPASDQSLPNIPAAKPTPARPFGLVPSTGNTSAATAPAKIITAPKPRLVESIPVKRDTNKLPPIESLKKPEIMEAAFENTETESSPLEFGEINRIRIKADNAEVETEETAADEIEDLAPFSMRFGAGLFDLIIGAFAAMLLLSPVAFTNENWFTTAGLLMFAGACAIVMFLYMTICLGFLGKTMGMRLFSLELVDAVENEYPTLRQAAVNSSIFLISLGLGGIGFLAVFFNEENRAAHDLLSGTILVREF